MFRTLAFAFSFTAAGVVTVSAQTPRAPTWGVTIGAAAFAVPSYPGSKASRVVGFPVINVTWRDRAYFGPSPSGVTFGMGYKVVRTASVVVAPEMGFQQDRPASRAAGLAGMEDRAVATTAGVSVTYVRGALTAAVSGSQGVNEGAGFLGNAQVTLLRPLSARMLATVGAGIAFADARQMRREFGVSGAEAARRGDLMAGGSSLPADAANAYAPAAGLRSVSASVGVVRFLSPHWVAIGSAAVERLGNEAAGSSLVERRTQLMGGVGVGYRF